MYDDGSLLMRKFSVVDFAENLIELQRLSPAS